MSLYRHTPWPNFSFFLGQQYDRNQMMHRVDGFRSKIALPNPSDEMLKTPLFEAIWQCIKSWDINVPDAYSGYCGATGSHVAAIIEAISANDEP